MHSSGPLTPRSDARPSLPRRAAASLLRAAAACAFGLALGTAIHVGFFDRFSHPVSEREVREQVAERMPVSIGQPNISILVEDIWVDFLDSGKVQADVGLRFSGRGLSGTATATLETGLRYADGALFFDTGDVTDLAFTPDDASLEFIEAVAANSSRTWAYYIRNPWARTPEIEVAWRRVEEQSMQRIEPQVRTLLSNLLLSHPAYHIGESSQRLSLEGLRISANMADPTFDMENANLRNIALALFAAALGLFALGSRLRRGAT